MKKSLLCQRGVYTRKKAILIALVFKYAVPIPSYVVITQNLNYSTAAVLPEVFAFDAWGLQVIVTTESNCYNDRYQEKNFNLEVWIIVTKRESAV